VVSAEPARPENPLLKADSCLITPHIARATARQNLMNSTVANIKAFVAGRPINVVTAAISDSAIQPSCDNWDRCDTDNQPSGRD